MGDGLEASTTIWSIWLEHGSCVNLAMTSLGDTWAQCCGCYAWERCLIYLVPQVERAPPAQRFLDTSWKGILIWLEMPTVPSHLHIAQSPRPHFRSFVLNTFPNSLDLPNPLKLPKCPQPAISPLCESCWYHLNKSPVSLQGLPKCWLPNYHHNGRKKKSTDLRWCKILTTACVFPQCQPQRPMIPQFGTSLESVGTSFYRNGFLWASPGRKSYNWYDWWRSEFLFLGAFSINGCAANIAITQPTK